MQLSRGCGGGGVHPVVCMLNKISRTQLHYIKINLAIPARVEVEVTLNLLAAGNTYRTLQHLFRIGSCRLQLQTTTAVSPTLMLVVM
jgi:hypothetical protein